MLELAAGLPLRVAIETEGTLALAAYGQHALLQVDRHVVGSHARQVYRDQEGVLGFVRVHAGRPAGRESGTEREMLEHAVQLGLQVVQVTQR